MKLLTGFIINCFLLGWKCEETCELAGTKVPSTTYRRQGIAKELLDRVIREAKEYGCGTVQITASDMGVKLYTAYGFVHNGNFMQYKLF